MSRARRRLALALPPLALAVAGCISVFPKQKPAQLYRFDVAPAGTPADPSAPRIDLVAPPAIVSRASAGDQILAITAGHEAAYIAGARWISPAAVLWDEAVRRAFSERSRGVRLLSRAELAGGRGFLRTDVPTFEARYAAAGAAPTVHVTLHAMLAHRSGVFAAEQTFHAEAPASEDRVSAIVPAFDQAVESAVGQLVAWADAHAAEAAQEPPSTGAQGRQGETAGAPTRLTTTTSTTTAPPRR